jgi:urease accessory protein
MLDARPAIAAADRPAQPRAVGAAAIRVARRRGADRVAGLRQQGSAKCMIPRGAGRPEAVFLNTAGGLTGGDRFEWGAEVEAGAGLTVATQTAERVYRAQPGETAEVTTRLRLGAGAALDWLAQETILFDGGALTRRLEIDMAGDAVFTGVEPLVLGRAAMGETVREARFRDAWRLRRDGRLIWADALRLVGPVAEVAGRPAALGGGIAAATLVHAAPGAAARLEALRGLLVGHEGVEAGASAFEDLIVGRLVARDGRALRRALVAALTGLRGGPPPRVWMM